MLGVLLDAGVIILLVQLVNEGDAVEWFTAIMCAVAISIGFVALNFVPPPWIWFGLPVMAVVAGFVIGIGCSIPLKRAMIAGGLFLVWKIAFIFGMLMLFSS